MTYNERCLGDERYVRDKSDRNVARYLETAVNEPSNAEARNGMAVAQYIAGMAFSNVGLGVVHGMAHPLGAIFDVPHGVANALLLPIVMEFNAPAHSINM